MKAMASASCGKLRLVRLELAGVDAAAQPPHPYRVLQVQHLVVKQVFNRITGARRPVEDPAHHNRVVRGVVVPQRTPGICSLQVSSGRPNSPPKKRTFSESKTSSRL